MLFLLCLKNSIALLTVVANTMIIRSKIHAITHKTVFTEIDTDEEAVVAAGDAAVSANTKLAFNNKIIKRLQYLIKFFFMFRSSLFFIIIIQRNISHV